jgi:DNA-binding winged helix-turn-helix (wHTH) protein
MPRFTFGPFSLDPEARVLLHENQPLPVGGKTLDTLLFLVQNRGRLVDKDELLSRIWAGSVVEEANLTQSISAVRKILGDSPKDHRFIATVAGRGYQFVAPVAEIRDEMTQRAREPVERNPFWSRNRGMLLGIVVLLVGITAAVWFALRRPVATPALRTAASGKLLLTCIRERRPAIPGGSRVGKGPMLSPSVPVPMGSTCPS